MRFRNLGMGLENLCSVKKENFDKIFKEYFRVEDISSKVGGNKSDFYGNYELIKIHLINPNNIDDFLYHIFEHIITFCGQNCNTFARNENIKYIKSVGLLTKYMGNNLGDLKEGVNLQTINNGKSEYFVDIDLQKLSKLRELGELILFFLTEGLLSSPIAFSKMRLKTNSQMPIFGTDGVHISHCGTKLYFGESKFTESFDNGKEESRKSLLTFSTKTPNDEIDIIGNNVKIIDEDKNDILEKLIDPYYNLEKNIDTFEYELVTFLGYKDKNYADFFVNSDITSYESKLDDKIVKLLKYYKLKELELKNKKITFFLLPLINTFDLLKKYALKLEDEENLETINSK